MAKTQFGMAKTMFLIIWMQVIPVALHLWRSGDRFDGGFIFAMTSGLSVLGVLAISAGVYNVRKEALSSQVSPSS